MSNVLLKTPEPSRISTTTSSDRHVYLVTQSTTPSIPLTIDDVGTAVDEIARPVFAFVDALNRGDVGAAVAELAPDALHYGRVSNYRPEGVRVLFTMLREVFPDLHMDITDISVEGNRVTSRIIATGTHTGSFLGKPATGQAVVWHSVDVAEIGQYEDMSDGMSESSRKIMKRFWDVWNDPDLWVEIGFMPAIMC